MTTVAELEARLRALEDIRAIEQLKYRYFRALDCQDWPALRACFTADVATDFESGQYSFAGIDAVMEFLSSSFTRLSAAGYCAVHLGNHPEVELLDERRARGQWTLNAPILDAGAGRPGLQVSFYRDEYRKENGIWRICRTGYTNYMKGNWLGPDLSSVFGADSGAD